MDANPLIPLVVVLGPTGTGKSELAIKIAHEFDGEIVNCDSLQLYRGFDIGTAKVPGVLRGGVPHHLIDILEPTELFTAGEFRGQFVSALILFERVRLNTKESEQF